MSSMVGVRPGAPSGRQPLDLAALKRTAIELSNRVRRPGLVTRFTVIGATMALLVATTLAGLIETRLTEHIMDLTLARAVDQVELGILTHVERDDFTPPFPPERLADLASRLDPHMSDLIATRSGVLRLHVFALDGTVIYSDLAAKRGQATPLTALLGDALGGRPGTMVSALTSAENADLKARHDAAYEVYVPFVVDGNVVGAYEIYADLAPVRPIRQLVWIAVVGGFIILFLSLFAVVRNAGAYHPAPADRAGAADPPERGAVPLAGRQHRRRHRHPGRDRHGPVRQPAGRARLGPLPRQPARPEPGGAGA